MVATTRPCSNAAGVVTAAAFPLPGSEYDFGYFVRRWAAYNRTDPARREALFGFDVPRRTVLPERVAVRTYRRTIRVAGMPFLIGFAVIVREGAP